MWPPFNTSTLKQILGRRLGSEWDFSRNVLVPQIFSFIALIVIGSFARAEVTSLTVSNLAMICFVLIFKLVAAWMRMEFTVGLLVCELIGASAMLLALSVLLSSGPFLSFYLPFTLLSLSVLVLRPWKGKGLKSGSEATGMIAPRDPVRSIRPMEHLTPAGELGGFHEDLSLRLARELGAEFSRGLGTISLLTSSLVFATIYLHNLKSKSFALAWVAIALGYLFMHRTLLHERKLLHVYLRAALIAATILLWWGLLVVFQVPAVLFVDFALLLIILGLGLLPWSAPMALGMMGVLAVVGGARTWEAPFPLAYFAALAISLVLFFRNAMAIRAEHQARAAGVLMSHWLEAMSSRAALTLLAWIMTQLVAAKRALMILGKTDAEILSGHERLPSPVDQAYVRGLVDQVESLGVEGGLLKCTTLGEQYRAPLLDWFSFLPQRLFFVRVRAVMDDKEQAVLVFVPIARWLIFGGGTRIFAGVVMVSTLVRTWLSVARTNFLSSDVLEESRRIISEREYELNQVVHRVNNAAQDIAIQCEQMRGGLQEVVRQPLANGDVQEQIDRLIYPQIERVELSVRHLSTGVSDVKILKELLGIKNFENRETCDLSSLIEDLDAFGKYQSYREGNQFILEKDGIVAQAVSVASREFLDSSLRLCVRLAAQRTEKSGQVKVALSVAGETLRIDVADSGKPITAEERTAILERNLGSTADETDYLKAVMNFARLSQGEFSFSDPPSGFTNCVRLSLPLDLSPQRGAAGSEGWVLLVDDNKEVSTFYARVAEALDLRYFIGASVQEARSLIDQNGEPRLVITDIQLTDGSGLDLVRSVRERFGTALPIIVVSGSTEKSIVDQVKQAGASKYLAKPVGRKKLFAEIQSVL